MSRRAGPERGTPGKAFRNLGDIYYGGAPAIESFAAVDEAPLGATKLWRDVVEDPAKVDPDALLGDGLAFPRAKREESGVLA